MANGNGKNGKISDAKNGAAKADAEETQNGVGKPRSAER